MRDRGSARVKPSFVSVIVQILLLDIVFSLDSVITAVGMVDEIWIMIAAVVVAVLFMMVFASPISNFVDRHPTVKMLALSFLLLIGVTLLAEAFDRHIPKGYIYFAMAFSVFVEMLNSETAKVSCSSYQTTRAIYYGRVESLRPSAYLCVLCVELVFNTEKRRDTQRAAEKKGARNENEFT